MSQTPKAVFWVSIGIVIAVGVLFSSIFVYPSADAAAPPIFNFQGRLEDSAGNLYGGQNGANFDFKFSIWNTSTTGQGTQLWPASGPASTTHKVTAGVFDAPIGDTAYGFAALDLDFNTSTAYYLQIAVWNTTSTAFETLAPRQAILSSGFAINADTVDGAHAGTSANNVLKLDPSGGINLPSGSSTFAGAVTVSGVTTLAGVSFTGATSTGDVFVYGMVSSTQMRTPSSTITGLTFTNASGTNISATGYGTFPTLNFTNASGTNLTASGFLQTDQYLYATNASGTFYVSTPSAASGTAAHTFKTTNNMATTFGATTDYTYLARFQNNATDKFLVYPHGYIRPTGGVYVGITPTDANVLVYNNYFYTARAATSTWMSLAGVAQPSRVVSSTSSIYGTAFEVRLTDTATNGTFGGAHVGGDMSAYLQAPTISGRTYGSIFGGQFTWGANNAGDYATTTVTTIFGVRSRAVDSSSATTSLKRWTSAGFYDMAYTTWNKAWDITDFYGIRAADVTDSSSTRNYVMHIPAQDGQSSGATQGNIYFEGGDWNTGHVQINTGHMWASGGAVSIKGSAPSAANDYQMRVSSSTGVLVSSTLAIATSSMYGSTSTLTVCAKSNCTTPATASSTNTVAFFASTGGATTDTSIVARGVITSGLADIGEFVSVVGSENDYEAGDLLAVSAAEPGKFEKTKIAYDAHAVGVVTKTAGLVAGGGEDSHGNTIIALAGRVSVKVTTEGGAVEAGDYLTPSSIPGVAMKATVAGTVVGQALTAFNGGETGSVMMFVKNGYFNGTGGFMAERGGASPVRDQVSNGASGILSEQERDLFSRLFVENAESFGVGITETSPVRDLISNGTSTDKKVVLKRGLVVTGDSQFEGNATFISGLHVLDDLSVGSRADAGAAITMTSDGNVTVKGELRAGKIIASEIEVPGLDIVSSTLMSLTSSTRDLDERVAALEATMTNAAREETAIILEDLLSGSSGITMDGILTLRGGLRVDKIESVNDMLVFASDALFFGRPYFTSDTGGFAVVAKGERRVDIVFEKEYVAQPVVNATITFEARPVRDSVSNGEASINSADAPEEIISANNIQYVVINKSVKGFTILLNKPAPVDVPLSWIAFAIKDAKTFTLRSENVIEEPPQQAEVPEVVPIPDATSTISVAASPVRDQVSNGTSSTSETSAAETPTSTEPPASEASASTAGETSVAVSSTEAAPLIEPPAENIDVLPAPQAEEPSL